MLAETTDARATIALRRALTCYLAQLSPDGWQRVAPDGATVEDHVAALTRRYEEALDGADEPPAARPAGEEPSDPSGLLSHLERVAAVAELPLAPLAHESWGVNPGVDRAAGDAVLRLAPVLLHCIELVGSACGHPVPMPREATPFLNSLGRGGDAKPHDE